MNEQQLEAMLRRRGYIVIPTMDEPWNDGQHITVLTGYGTCTFGWDADFDTRETARLINIMLGDGQRHVSCKHCGTPLLRGVGGTGKGKGSTHWYEYRSVQAGPNSAVILFCPRCGVQLSEEHIREVEDDEEGTANSTTGEDIRLSEVSRSLHGK